MKSDHRPILCGFPKQYKSKKTTPIKDLWVHSFHLGLRELERKVKKRGKKKT